MPTVVFRTHRILKPSPPPGNHGAKSRGARPSARRIDQSAKRPDVKDRLGAAGFETIGSSSEQFASYIRTEIDKWGKVVKASGVRAD